MADFFSMNFDEEEEEDDQEEIIKHENNHQHQQQLRQPNGRMTPVGDHQKPTVQSNDAGKQGDNNEDNHTGFDNPAYRPVDHLPYTDFMSPEEKDTPIFSGNHLIHPKNVTGPARSNTVSRSSGGKYNSYSKANGHAVNFSSRRKKPSKNHYYHDNHYSYKNGTAQNYLGRRLGPHHKYATTRHSPILAYNNSRIALANGDIRKSQSLGRNSAHYLYQNGPAMIIPTPVSYRQSSFVRTPTANGAFENATIIHQNKLPNGNPQSPRYYRNSDGEGEDDDEVESLSRRESHSTGKGSSGAGAVINFLRHPMTGSLNDKKESCVAFFDIETDKVSSYMYRPGEEVSGVVTLVIRHTMEIRFVELVVTGRGQVVFRQPEGMSGKLGRTTKETYLYKRTYVIGSGDEAWSSLLTPGTYSSKFRVKLPKGLPSTLRHDDVANGMSIEIGYTLKARICDDPGPSASARSRTSIRSQRGTRQLVRILMTKQVNFNVQRGFDLSQVPGASVPFSHTEQLFMSCAHTEAAIVTVNLDRSVFLAGDDVKVQLTTSLPSGQRVKEIACSLQEHVTLDPKREPITILLSRMLRKEPGNPPRRTTNPGQEEENAFEVTMPTQTDLISPFSLGSSKAKIEYSLAISLKFSRSGGKLAFKVPLTIGPCADPIYAEKTSSRKIVPVFNRPTRFPYFTSPITAQPQQDRSQSGHTTNSQGGRAPSTSVQSKYSNNCLSRFFLCCASATD